MRSDHHGSGNLDFKMATVSLIKSNGYGQMYSMRTHFVVVIGGLLIEMNAIKLLADVF